MGLSYSPFFIGVMTSNNPMRSRITYVHLLFFLTVISFPSVIQYSSAQPISLSNPPNVGSTGKGDGQFAEIEHMATDKFNNIYVNDPQSGPNGSGMPRVQKFDTNGHFITKFGSFGSGDGQFVDPEHLAVDSDGNVYVTDRKNNNI